MHFRSHNQSRATKIECRGKGLPEAFPSGNPLQRRMNQDISLFFWSIYFLTFYALIPEVQDEGRMNELVQLRLYEVLCSDPCDAK